MTATALADSAATAGEPPLLGDRPTYEQHALQNAGNPVAGGALFQDAQRTKCAVCHKVDGRGGEVGPDLSAIGGKFDRPHLIESLLEPSRQIVAGYRTATIATDDGQVLTGILKQQDEHQVTLVDAEGVRHEVARAQIESLAESPASLMPEGLLRFGPGGALYVLLRNAWVIDDKFEPGTGSLLEIRPSGQRAKPAG